MSRKNAREVAGIDEGRAGLRNNTARPSLRDIHPRRKMTQFTLRFASSLCVIRAQPALYDIFGRAGSWSRSGLAKAGVMSYTERTRASTGAFMPEAHQARNASVLPKQYMSMHISR